MSALARRAFRRRTQPAETHVVTMGPLRELKHSEIAIKAEIDARDVHAPPHRIIQNGRR